MFTLNADGTVTVGLIDRVVAVRRPSIVEYRTLRESIEKLVDVHEVLVTEAQAWNDTYRAELLAREEGFDREEWAAKERQSRDNLRRVQASADEFRVVWLREILDTLSDAGDVGDEEIPAEVWGAQWPAQLQEHWRSRPFLRGAQ